MMGMQYSLKCGELMSLQCRAHRIRGMPAVRPTAGKKCLTGLQAGAWRVEVFQPVIQALDSSTKCNVSKTGGSSSHRIALFDLPVFKKHD
ncbi:MAG: hypothetical protein B7Y42_13340, partial [Polaromonas sp. 28-63-22]